MGLHCHVCNLSPAWTQALIAEKLGRSDGACAHILRLLVMLMLVAFFGCSINRGNLQLISIHQKSRQQWGARPKFWKNPSYLSFLTLVSVTYIKTKTRMKTLFCFYSKVKRIVRSFWVLFSTSMFPNILAWVYQVALWGALLMLHNDLQVDQSVHKWHLTLVCSRMSSSCTQSCKHMTLAIVCSKYLPLAY